MTSGRAPAGPALTGPAASRLGPAPGSVAQRLERTTHNREVDGSNPSGAISHRAKSDRPRRRAGRGSQGGGRAARFRGGREYGGAATWGDVAALAGALPRCAHFGVRPADDLRDADGKVVGRWESLPRNLGLCCGKTQGRARGGAGGRVTRDALGFSWRHAEGASVVRALAYAAGLDRSHRSLADVAPSDPLSRQRLICCPAHSARHFEGGSRWRPRPSIHYVSKGSSPQR